MSANATTYTREFGMKIPASEKVPSATAGIESGSGPAIISTPFCRIMASPMVTIMPLSSSRRNGFRISHSTRPPKAIAAKNETPTAARKGNLRNVVR